KSSSLAPAFSFSLSHSGCAPLPAHVLPVSSRYLPLHLVSPPRWFAGRCCAILWLATGIPSIVSVVVGAEAPHSPNHPLCQVPPPRCSGIRIPLPNSDGCCAMLPTGLARAELW